jgi:predicted lipid-binding transport protein (Tim44 family)
MPTGVIELIILAAIALFLLFRLRSVLGTKTGFEEHHGHVQAPRAEPARAHPVPAPPPPADDAEADDEAREMAGGDDRIAAALKAMRAAEPGFSAGQFVSGAKGAYEMILMAFETGDTDTLQRFLAPDVYQGFAGAIEERQRLGYSVEARFIGVREAQIVDARFTEDSSEAEIAIRFTGEMITTVRDTENRVVEGNPNEIRRETDTWTFARRMGSSDPNWLLVATGE